MSCAFSKEDVNFRFSHKELIVRWLNKAIKNESRKSGKIAFTFCSDKFLLKLNQDFLKHDYYTDIITFDYTVKKVISGEIFISIDRVKDNANAQAVSFQNELLHVMIHGVLHLCGYTDKSVSKAREMRLKEDYYLSLWRT